MSWFNKKKSTPKQAPAYSPHKSSPATERLLKETKEAVRPPKDNKK